MQKRSRDNASPLLARVEHEKQPTAIFLTKNYSWGMGWKCNQFSIWRLEMRFNLWELMSGLRARCIARWEKQWWLANFQIYLPKTNVSPLPPFLPTLSLLFSKVQGNQRETLDQLWTSLVLYTVLAPNDRIPNDAVFRRKYP